jgi:HAD superfamily hydrolase (TIGR01509 family)
MLCTEQAPKEASVTSRPTTGGLQAVLFDMDGLLVSTEETWFAVETQLMAELGSTWGPEHQAALVGGPLAHSAQYMLDLSGRSDIDRAWVETALLDGMVTRLHEGPVRWMPGARELLAEVTGAGVPAALVSSSSRNVMDAVLAAIGGDWFSTTVSADDVARTKPYADPYLAAAAALGLDPTCCVALEDSTTGAASARDAGCVTVAVPSVVPVDPATVDAVVASLADIDLSWLRDLVERRLSRV